MQNPIVRLAEALYRQPTEKPLTAGERRRELQAYYGLYLVFFVLAFGVVAFLAMGAPGPADPSDFLPGVAFATSVAFFLVWLTKKDRLENFYCALFAMVTGLVQLRFTLAFPREFNAADSASFDVFLLAVEGGFGLLFAMSVARARALVFQVGIPILVGAPVIIQPLVRLLELDFRLGGAMAVAFVPGCFLLGVAACILQGVAMSVHVPQARGRICRLFFYAAIFLALAAEGWLEAGYWARPGGGAAHLRVAELCLFLAAAGLSFYEHRLQSGRPARQAGFSLIELMIVVAVIGLLAAIAGPMYERYQSKSRQSEAKLGLSSLYASEKAFFSEYSAYISSFEALHYTPEGVKRFYTIGWNNPMSGTVNSFHGTYGTPNVSKVNVPPTFGCDYATGTAVLPAPVGSDQQTFSVGAAGGVRIGLGCDVWSIDDVKNLQNTVTAL